MFQIFHNMTIVLVNKYECIYGTTYEYIHTYIPLAFNTLMIVELTQAHPINYSLYRSS